jgi:cyclophilin family peptidyl-prolyl cis-trans isomerase
MARAREERIQARKAKTFRLRVLAIAVIVVVVIALVWFYQSSRPPPAASNPTKVILKTSKGDITIELFDDMPVTTSNFKNLVSQGIYDGTIFHRVIADFMIQGGDPTGTGYGDPSIPAIQDEFTDHNRNDRGTIAMANAGPNTGSSQFFINLVNNNQLDTKHPVFGKVIAGMDVVDAIGKVQTDESDRPLQEVMIFKAEVVEP